MADHELILLLITLFGLVVIFLSCKLYDQSVLNTALWSEVTHLRNNCNFSINLVDSIVTKVEGWINTNSRINNSALDYHLAKKLTEKILS